VIKYIELYTADKKDEEIYAACVYQEESHFLVCMWRRIDFEKLLSVLGNPTTCIALVSGREERKMIGAVAKGAMQDIPPTFCKVEMRLTHSALSALSARILPLAPPDLAPLA
jgi:hypothetical protein